MFRSFVVAAVACVALMCTGVALANYNPSVYDPDATGKCVATVVGNTLHLEKNGPTDTNCAAGADITGQEGMQLTELSFTMTDDSHCGAGSVRFDVLFSDGAFRIFTCFWGDSVDNGDGTFTVTFSDTTPFCDFQTPHPVGCFESSSTIEAMDILLDEGGNDGGPAHADITIISVNGVVQTPTPVGGSAARQPSGRYLLCDPNKGSVNLADNQVPGYMGSHAGTTFAIYVSAKDAFGNWIGLTCDSPAKFRSDLKTSGKKVDQTGASGTVGPVTDTGFNQFVYTEYVAA